jgi:four helix bundle protein
MSKLSNSEFARHLEERLEKFGEKIIEFARKMPKDVVTLPIIGQMVASATSMGANYCEANDGESKKDFKHKIGICRKESKETMHWLRMSAKACPELADKARILWQEAKEYNLIFGSIARSK